MRGLFAKGPSRRHPAFPNESHWPSRAVPGFRGSAVDRARSVVLHVLTHSVCDHSGRVASNPDPHLIISKSGTVDSASHLDDFVDWRVMWRWMEWRRQKAIKGAADQRRRRTIKEWDHGAGFRHPREPFGVARSPKLFQTPNGQIFRPKDPVRFRGPTRPSDHAPSNMGEKWEFQRPIPPVCPKYLTFLWLKRSLGPISTLCSGNVHVAQFRTTCALYCQFPDPLGELSGEDAQRATRGAMGSR
jgi:hypothetical protein